MQLKKNQKGKNAIMSLINKLQIFLMKLKKNKNKELHYKNKSFPAPV